MEIWEKIKGLYTGPGKFFTWFVTLWLLYFTWSWFFGSGNTIPIWINAKKEYRNQNAQIEVYKKEMAEMDAAIDRLESNPDTLEKFAREQYQFAAPGEDVYLLK